MNCKLTIVASIGERNELGRGGDLCWHIREDLKRFKQLTMGGAVIMGRKTWESLPVKPLPGRLNIVVSGSLEPAPDIPDMKVASSLEEAVTLAEGRNIFIIGGASIYRQTLPMADRLEITRILDTDDNADTFFPDIDHHEWELKHDSEIFTSNDGIKFLYQTYESRRNM